MNHRVRTDQLAYYHHTPLTTFLFSTQLSGQSRTGIPACLEFSITEDRQECLSYRRAILSAGSTVIVLKLDMRTRPGAAPFGFERNLRSA